MSLGEPALYVEDLTIQYNKGRKPVTAVREFQLQVNQGKCSGIIGESGCGKSLSCQAILGLLEPPKWQVRGKIFLNGQPVPIDNDQVMNMVRGKQIGLVVQDPMSAFDPRLTIASHFCLGIPRKHRKAYLLEAERQLARMCIADPAAALASYPFQLSGGMLQRILTAMAIFPHPQVLLADEPTTALDAATQQELLLLLQRLQHEEQLAIVLVSHDLGAISHMADTIYVMYAGQIVEWGEKNAILRHPAHPYTRGLFRSRPAFSKEPLTMMEGAPPRMEELDHANCPFMPRCPYGTSCRENGPLREIGQGHWSRCKEGYDGSVTGSTPA